VSLLLEYQQDLREECSKCGDVKRVVIYDVSRVFSFLVRSDELYIKNSKNVHVNKIYMPVQYYGDANRNVVAQTV
jgi:hypothetical protein